MVEQNISQEKYVFKTFSAIWEMFLLFNRISYNILLVTVWEDKEWCCATTDTILRIEQEWAENKIVYTFSWCFQSYLFNYTSTERLHSLTANYTWSNSVKWWSVFDTNVIKVLTNGFGSRHEHWVGFKLCTTSINDLGILLLLFWVMLFHIYILGKGGSESYLATTY